MLALWLAKRSLIVQVDFASSLVNSNTHLVPCPAMKQLRYFYWFSHDHTGELMELTMRVNSEAHFWTTQGRNAAIAFTFLLIWWVTIRLSTSLPLSYTLAVLPKMIEKNQGHIVTISSAAGVVGVPGLADYSASKHAAKVCGICPNLKLIDLLC